MNARYNAIRSALESIGADELFEQIIEAQSASFDALVLYDADLECIVVDSVPHGASQQFHEQVLLHREEARPVDYDYGFDYHDLFHDDEIDFITESFDGTFSDYLESRHNHRGSLEQRIEEARRFYWGENWYDTVHEWAERAALGESEQ